MGTPKSVSYRVVFDTASVVSALVYSAGRVGWLRQHWREGECVPLISHETAAELMRVLRYSKFKLPPEEVHELLADYLPYCEVVEKVEPCAVKCRDASDQPFLDLAHTAKAEFLVSGDRDLLALAGHAAFAIETPEGYRRRVNSL